MNTERAERDNAEARLLLVEIIREARDLSDLLTRTTIRHSAAGHAPYLLDIRTAHREIGNAFREAYRKANPPPPPKSPTTETPHHEKN